MPDFHIPNDPEWQWAYDLILYGVGEEFPEADPSALRAMGGELDDFARQLLNGMAATANVGNALDNHLDGPAADAFNQFRRRVTQQVPAGGEISTALGAAAYDFALDSENTQYNIIIAAFTQVVEIALALASGFGAPAVPGLVKIGQEIVKTLIKIFKGRLGAVLLRISQEALEEGLEELWQAAAAQTIQILEGNRQGLDYRDLAISFAGGAFIGAGTTGMTMIGGKLFPNTMKNVLAREVYQGLAETLFEGLFNMMVNGGSFNPFATFTSSVIGGMAHHQATVIGEQFGGNAGAPGTIPPPPVLTTVPAITGPPTGSGPGQPSSVPAGTTGSPGSMPGPGASTPLPSSPGAQPTTGGPPTNSTQPTTGSPPPTGTPASTGTPPTSGNQPATGTPPATSTPSGDGSQPSTGAQPTTGNPPDTGSQPTTGSAPDTGSQPTTGSAPDTGSQPTTGSAPTGGSQPSAGTQPAASSEVTAGAPPATGGQPVSHASVIAVEAPVDGSTATPLAGSTAPHSDAATAPAPNSSPVQASPVTPVTSTPDFGPSAPTSATAPNSSAPNQTTVMPDPGTPNGSTPNGSAQPPGATPSSTPASPTAPFASRLGADLPGTAQLPVPGVQPSPAAAPTSPVPPNTTPASTDQQRTPATSPAPAPRSGDALSGPGTRADPPSRNSAPASAPPAPIGPATGTIVTVDAPALPGVTPAAGPETLPVVPAPVQTPSQAPKKRPTASASTSTPAIPAQPMSAVLSDRSSRSFRDALRNFDMQQVDAPIRINELASRTTADDSRPAYLATVPVTPGTDLQALVDRYAEGFDGDSSQGRFGLVIGVNGFAGRYTAQQIRDTVARISAVTAPFPVVVFGFSWNNGRIGPGQSPGQDTIPYAAIRETLVRHPAAEVLLSELQAQSEATFLHTGDADVDSMRNPDGGLFDRVDAVVASHPQAQLISGGYQFDAAAPAVAKQANRRDLAAREAMARIDPRAVYLPEPNTLIRLDQGRLENSITFGVRSPSSTDFTYTSKEGRGLADSVTVNRRALGLDPNVFTVFDSTLTVTTESARLLQNYDPGRPDRVPQSHADPTTWADQVQHMILTAPEYQGIAPTLAVDLSRLAFSSITPVSEADKAAIVAEVKRYRGQAKPLLQLAAATHAALRDNPHTGVQTSSQAPPSQPGQVPVAVAGPETRNMPAEWQPAYDAATPHQLRTERYDPHREPFVAGNPLMRGQLTTIDFQVREFRTPDGVDVRAFDVHLDLVSPDDELSPEDRRRYGDAVRNTVNEMINGRYSFSDGRRFHVNLTFDTPPWRDGMTSDWETDPNRNPPVVVTSASALDTHQHQWKLSDSPALGVHEVMHYLGAKEGYASDLLFPRDRPGVMGQDALELPTTAAQAPTGPAGYLTGTDLSLIQDVARLAGPVRTAPPSTSVVVHPSDESDVQTPSRAPAANRSRTPESTSPDQQRRRVHAEDPPADPADTPPEPMDVTPHEPMSRHDDEVWDVDALLDNLPDGATALESENYREQLRYLVENTGRARLQTALETVDYEGSQLIELLDATAESDGGMPALADLVEADPEVVSAALAGIDDKAMPGLVARLNSDPTQPAGYPDRARAGTSRVQRITLKRIRALGQASGMESATGHSGSGRWTSMVEVRGPRSRVPDRDTQALQQLSAVLYAKMEQVATTARLAVKPVEVQTMLVNDRLVVSTNNPAGLGRFLDHLASRPSWTSEGTASQLTSDIPLDGDPRLTRKWQKLRGIETGRRSGGAVGVAWRSARKRDVLTIDTTVTDGVAMLTDPAHRGRLFFVTGRGTAHAEQTLLRLLHRARSAGGTLPAVIAGKKRPCVCCYLTFRFAVDVLGMDDLVVGDNPGGFWAEGTSHGLQHFIRDTVGNKDPRTNLWLTTMHEWISTDMIRSYVTAPPGEQSRTLPFSDARRYLTIRDNTGNTTDSDSEVSDSFDARSVDTDVEMTGSDSDMADAGEPDLLLVGTTENTPDAQGDVPAEIVEDRDVQDPPPPATAAGQDKPWTVFGLDGRDRTQIASAIVAGYRRFDTAASYGESTNRLAEVLQEQRLDRNAYEVVYKFDLIAGESPQQLRNRLVTVADQFGGRLDDLLIHNMQGAPQAALSQAWQVMRQLRAEGLATRLGLGNIEDAQVPLVEHLSGLGRIDVVENSAESLLRTPAVRDWLLGQYAANHPIDVYYYGARALLRDITQDANSAVNLDDPATMTALAVLIAGQVPGTTHLIASSGSAERQAANLQHDEPDPFTAPDGQLGPLFSTWTQTSRIVQHNGPALDLPEQVHQGLVQLLDPGTVGSWRDQIRDAAPGGQPDTASITGWLVAQNIFTTDQLATVRVPDRIGLRRQYAGKSLGEVVAALLGPTNCNWKWSAELVQTLIVSVDDWMAFAGPALENITEATGFGTGSHPVGAWPAGNGPDTRISLLTVRDYGFLLDVNPYRELGGDFTTNCELTAIATDLALRYGEKFQAPPADPGPAGHLENYADGPLTPMPGLASVVQLMHDQGPGARGIVVLGSVNGSVDHAFNVVHDHNGVVFLDGQLGDLARIPVDPVRIRFVSTTAIDGSRRPAPAVDSEILLGAPLPPPPPPPPLPPPPPPGPPSTPTSGAGSHTLGTGPAARRLPEFGKAFTGTSIGVECELANVSCALPNSATRTFAYVRSTADATPLVQLTKDMSNGTVPDRPDWSSHTLELVTYPVEADSEEVGRRNRAVVVLLDHLDDHLGQGNGPLETTALGPEFELIVVNEQHLITTSRTAPGEVPPSVSMPRSMQQVTVGVPAGEFTSSSHPVISELRRAAAETWYQEELRATALSLMVSGDISESAAVADAYAYVVSVINFLGGLVTRHHLTIGAYEPPDGSTMGLTHPTVKNAWGILPRTSPRIMIDALPEAERSAVLLLVRNTAPPAGMPANAWYEARAYVLGGSDIAGHGINDATVAGTPALLFEYRSVTDAVVRYVPQRTRPAVTTVDLASTFGPHRQAAVARVNAELASGDNITAFSAWLRPNLPAERAGWTPDRIARVSTANQRMQWLMETRPEWWRNLVRDFTPATAAPAPHLGGPPPPPPLPGFQTWTLPNTTRVTGAVRYSTDGRPLLDIAPGRQPEP